MQDEQQQIKNRTRDKAKRTHKGHHWHVEIRSSVIICRACEAKIPKHLDPQFCPKCGSGSEENREHWDR